MSGNLSCVEYFITATLGLTPGFAHAAYGHGGYWNSGRYTHRQWIEHTYTWPDQRADLLTDIAQQCASGEHVDIYLNPYVLTGRRRAKNTAAARRLVHVDRDGTTPLDPALVQQLGVFVVDSGTPGHEHVYLPVQDSLSAAQHEALCRELAARIGDCDAKVSDNDVLRVPGTLNYKHSPPRPVQWVRKPAKARPVRLVAELLGVDLAAVHDRPTPGGGQTVPVDADDLPERVRAALESNTGDRSVDTMRVVGAAYSAGLTLGQARSVIRLRSDLDGRLAERKDDDVLSCWLKATDERQQRRRQRADPATLTVPTPNPESEADSERLTADENLTTASPAALEFQTFAELCAEVDAAGPRKWLLRGWWPAGDYGVHGAGWKAQKTWNAVDLAVSVASGTDWLGAVPVDDPGPVLTFLGEGGKANYVRRMRAICDSRGLKMEDLPGAVCARAPHLSDAEHLSLMRAQIEATRPRLVIIDPLFLAAGGADGKDLYAMGALLERPQHLCASVGAALLVVTHFNRSRDGKESARITGAGPAEWGRVLITADTVASSTDDETKESTVTTDLDAIGGEIPEQGIRIRRRIVADDPDDLNSGMRYTVEVLPRDASDSRDGNADLSPAALKLLEALADLGEPATNVQLVDRIKGHHGHGLKRETVSRELNALLKAGRVRRIDPAGIGMYAVWTMPPADEPANNTRL